MRIVWTKPAIEDVDGIWEYLKERSTNAAGQVQETILKAVERLAEFPYLGRPGHLAGTRELVIARYPYIVIYGVVEGLEHAETEIVIYHVYHGAQNWREALEEEQ
jgi:toxin ParE1/3/4